MSAHVLFGLLAHRIRISEFYPGIKNLILPMLSYPGCHMRATCIGCIGTLLSISDVIM